MIDHGKTTRATIAGVVLVSVGVACAAPALADQVDNYVAVNADVVCQGLDQAPTLHSVEVLGEAIVRDTGWDYQRAGSVLVQSIVVVCPRHRPLWDQFVAANTSNSTTVQT